MLGLTALAQGVYSYLPCQRPPPSVHDDCASQVAAFGASSSELLPTKASTKLRAQTDRHEFCRAVATIRDHLRRLQWVEPLRVHTDVGDHHLLRGRGGRARSAGPDKRASEATRAERSELTWQAMGSTLASISTGRMVQYVNDGDELPLAANPECSLVADGGEACGC